MRNYTKNAIKTSFLKLLNEQPLGKISVRSIVEDCGINRNSFYYHYQDIPALVEEIVRDACDALIAQYPDISSLDEGVEAALHFAQENRRAVLHIYQSANREIYERYSMQLCEYIAQRYLDTLFGPAAVCEGDHMLFIQGLKCTLYGLGQDWIMSGMKEDLAPRARRTAVLFRGLGAELIRRSNANPSVE